MNSKAQIQMKLDHNFFYNYFEQIEELRATTFKNCFSPLLVNHPRGHPFVMFTKIKVLTPPPVKMRPRDTDTSQFTRTDINIFYFDEMTSRCYSTTHDRQAELGDIGIMVGHPIKDLDTS